MESMIGPTEVPANGSAYPMNCDYAGVVFENDGGIGMIDLPKCKKCGMVCVDQIIAEPPRRIAKQVTPVDVKQKMLHLGWF